MIGILYWFMKEVSLAMCDECTNQPHLSMPATSYQSSLIHSLLYYCDIEGLLWKTLPDCYGHSLRCFRFPFWDYTHWNTVACKVLSVEGRGQGRLALLWSDWLSCDMPRSCPESQRFLFTFQLTGNRKHMFRSGENCALRRRLVTVHSGFLPTHKK